MENSSPVTRNEDRWRFVEWSPIVLGALAATALSVLLGFGAAIGLGISSTAPTWRDASAALAILSGLYLVLQAFLSFGLGGTSPDASEPPEVLSRERRWRIRWSKTLNGPMVSTV
jgi:hypothetical protein